MASSVSVNAAGLIGPAGSSGFSGYSGAGGSGFSGYSGIIGTSGFSGYSGFSGTNGVIGGDGTSGFSGYSGNSTSGFSGYSGFSGVGTSGFSGYSGNSTSGFSGYSGFSGTNGVIGGDGTSGFSGYSGVGTSGFSGYSSIGTSGFSGYSSIGTSGFSGYSSIGTSGFSGYSGVGTSGFSGYSGTGTSGFSGYSGPGTDISFSVNQTAHGFSVGQAIYFTGTVYALAKSDAAATLGFLLVRTVTNDDNFVAIQAGLISGLSSLTAGEYYYVSAATAGVLTATEPTSFSNPILLATSTTTGVVLPFRPSQLSSGDIDLVNNDIIGAKTIVYYGEYNCGNSGTSISVAWTNGQNQRITLNDNTTITVGTPPGVGHFQIRLIQDGTGGRTVAWSGLTSTRWLGATSAPAVNNAINGETIVSIYYDGTNLTQSLSKVGAV